MDNWVLAAIFLGGTLWVTEVSAEDAERRIIANLYVDMEAGALGDVITTNLLDKMTHGTGGTWGLKCGRFGAPHKARQRVYGFLARGSPAHPRFSGRHYL